jgi:hypothetical protein
MSSSAPHSAQYSENSKRSLGLYQSQMYQEEPFKDITSPTLNKHNKGENISSLVSNFGMLSKPSSILQPFQSSYLIATPNAMTGALGVSPFNLKHDPLDKENRGILMSEDPKYKHPTSYAAS